MYKHTAFVGVVAVEVSEEEEEEEEPFGGAVSGSDAVNTESVVGRGAMVVIALVEKASLLSTSRLPVGGGINRPKNVADGWTTHVSGEWE